MKAAGLSIKEVAGQTISADSASQKWRHNLTVVGSEAGKVGLLAAGALTAAVVKAANFDQAMSNVQAATHETAEAMADLRQAALDAGADTAFSATEAAAAVEELAKAGVSTSEILSGGLAGSLDLAAAGNLDVGTAAEIAATALTQFNLAGAEVPHVADLLAAGAGKAQGEVTDLSMALKQSGLVASQFGISIEETVGTLSAFAASGLLGSDAGTSFRTMLLRLANPSAEAARRMRELGIAAYDTEGNFVGVEALAGQLRVAFEGQEQATRDAALATIFGSDAIRAANVLYANGSEGIAEWTSKVNDSGYAAETAAIKQDNLRGDIEKLTGALETLLITGGDGAQGFLRKPTQALTAFVDVLNEVPGPVKDVTAGLLGIVAITGGALWFGSKVIRAVADTKAALDGLNISGSKTAGILGKATKALGAFATALVVADVANSLGPDTSSVVRRNIEAIDSIAGPSVEARLDAAREALERYQEASKQSGWKSFVTGSDGLLFGFGDRGVKDARDTADALKEVIADLEQEQQLAFFATQKQRLELAALGVQSRYTAEDIAALDEAIKDGREAAASQAEAFIGLGKSLDDSKVSLTGWIGELEKQAKALEQFTANAQAAGEKGLNEGLIEALREAGPEGARRMEQLANASQSEIDRANDAWERGQDAIKDFTDQAVSDLERAREAANTPIVPQVDTGPALTAFERLAQMSTAYHSPLPGLPGGPALNRAAGGPVFGPGTGTSDSIPINVSNGEYVIRAAAVEKYGIAMFDRLNSMGCANGGHVGEAFSARRYQAANYDGGWDSAAAREGTVYALRQVFAEREAVVVTKRALGELQGAW